MTKIEMLDQIAIIQPYIDSLVNKNYVKFANPSTEISILENLYNQITGRKYLKFNSGCGSCLKEALILCDNFRKKVIKELEAEAVTMSEPEAPKQEVVKTPSKSKVTKSNVKRSKPKTK